MSTTKIIAIDGPAGSGKSTIAKMVAQHLGLLYLDSGAFYRAATLSFLRNKLTPPFTGARVEEVLSHTDIQLKQENGSAKVYLNGEDVSSEIRFAEVTSCVSEVSESALVRKIITEKLRELTESQSVVMDGRDIGTVVFPNADLKIFMTATPDERAKRRYLELKNVGVDSDFDEIKDSIIKRDRIDSNREIAPLSKADDAISLDTTEMTIEAVVDFVIKKYNRI